MGAEDSEKRILKVLIKPKGVWIQWTEALSPIKLPHDSHFLPVALHSLFLNNARQNSAREGQRVCVCVCACPVHAAVRAQCTVNNVKRISWFLRVSLCAATYCRETCPRPGAFKRPRPSVRPLGHPGVDGKMMDSTSPGSFARHFSVAWLINSATHFPHPFVSDWKYDVYLMICHYDDIKDGKHQRNGR